MLLKQPNSEGFQADRGREENDLLSELSLCMWLMAYVPF